MLFDQSFHLLFNNGDFEGAVAQVTVCPVLTEKDDGLSAFEPGCPVQRCVVVFVQHVHPGIEEHQCLHGCWVISHRPIQWRPFSTIERFNIGAGCDESSQD